MLNKESINDELEFEKLAKKVLPEFEEKINVN